MLCNRGVKLDEMLMSRTYFHDLSISTGTHTKRVNSGKRVNSFDEQIGLQSDAHVGRPKRSGDQLLICNHVSNLIRCLPLPLPSESPLPLLLPLIATEAEVW